MWLKRKKRNRRLEREHLIDVKLRSQQLRAARLRFAGIACSVLLCLVLTTLLVWRGGEWLLNRFIYENDAFAIREIEITTDGVIAPEHLRRWTLIKPNQNLLALDLARVKRDLELVPVIHSASVERILPNTLRIRVVEREPVAQVKSVRLQAGGGYEQVVYHLDEHGVVFRPLDPRLRSRPPEFSHDHLAVISGIDARELREGRKVDSEQILGALGLILEFDRSPMFGIVELSRIDVAAPDILHIYTAQGSEVFFSLGDCAQQLHRWRLVHDRTQRWNKAIASLDLSISNNLPLRLAESTPSSSRPPLNPKPTRTKKKNV